LRQKVHTPVFASFDGVSRGMILDLSEEGLAMQMGSSPESSTDEHLLRNSPLAPGSHLTLELDLGDPGTQFACAKLETTGYVAWADALGRAGVRFSDLPEESRERLSHWLMLHASTPALTAPKISVGWPGTTGSAHADAHVQGSATTGSRGERVAVSFEAGPAAAENARENGSPATAEYEFTSLSTDLNAALRLIAERARALTRGASAAIALVHKDSVICRASVGVSAPPLGARLDVNRGISGECFREARAMRCDDVEHDARVDLAICRRLGVRSIVAAAVRYERDTIGLLMVFGAEPFNFDEGDVAVVDSLAHTVVRCVRQAENLGRGTLAG
jgi:hypothetical protein